ncbi:MAG TPA: ABC transporter substrate-binding protein [Salinisphaeraceae bacterium]|nr:ABC transporter substrate-binding protein [Salinisphaeraceae bacterium]
MISSLTLADTSAVKFGIQPWPGVTVKTEVATDILEVLGYETEKLQLNTPFILHGIVSGQVDVALGGWYPISAAMITPLVEEGKLIRLTANLPHALSGMAVPVYVHEAGVDSVEDLSRYADRFGHKIYGNEAGGTWPTQVQELIDADEYGLGDWKVVTSATASMLVQVGRATDNNGWILFYGWKPHWMNIKYDLYYLKGPEDSPVVDTKATIYTIVRTDYPETNPNVARFLKQFKVDSEIQSQWVYGNSYEQHPAEDVAQKWIAANLDLVEEWLQGVTTAEGEPAFPAIEAAYGS